MDKDLLAWLIILGLVVASFAGFAVAALYEHYDNKRWARKAAERIYEKWRYR